MPNKGIHRIKLIISTIFFLLPLGTMCACTDANGAIPSDREVFEKVSSICTNEEYELVSRVDISDATPPACVKYTFVTKERGLEFTAHSTLQNIAWEGPSAWYSKVVHCNYAKAVQSLYEDDVRSEIEKCPLYSPERNAYYISSFSQVETIAESLAAAQEIYRQELQYNSVDFLRENFLFWVNIYGLDDSAADCLSGSDIMNYVYSDSFNRRNTRHIADMRVGVWQYDEIYDPLAMRVTERYMDGSIYLEDGVPQEYIERWYQAQADPEE